MGWNGSDRKGAAPVQPKVTAKKPSPIRGLVAGGAVVALVVVAYFVFFSGSEKPQDEKADKGRGRIKEVAPAAAPKTGIDASVTTNKIPKMKTYRDNEGVLRWESGARAYDPSRTYKPLLVPGGNERRIFRHVSERMIENLVRAVPGERRMSAANYNSKAFQRDFAAAMEDPIVINPEDTPSDRERKQAMIEIKKELKERIAAGEKIGDILTETNNELKRLAEYSDKVKAQVKDLVKNGDNNFSEQDVQDLIGAANKMLEENGCNPIRGNQIMIWNIRANAKRMGLSKEEGDAKVREYREKNRKNKGDRKE